MEPLKITRKVFLNKSNGQAVVYLPKKDFKFWKGKNPPKEIEFEIKNIKW